MASEYFALAAPAVENRQAPSREIAIRFLLSALCVVLCYCFQWYWLRVLTCTANLNVDRMFGVYLLRISPLEVGFGGRVYNYAIACTLADAWCGALPLLWSTRRNIARNLGEIATFTFGLFAFNLARLSISDFLIANGASWTWGHSVFCGCAYFLVWLWICRPGTPLERLWPFAPPAAVLS